MAIWKPKTKGKASRYYWGSFTHPKTLKRVRTSLKTTDRSAAEIVLNEMQRRAAREAANMVDPYEAHVNRPLTEHLDDWSDSLANRGATAPYVKLAEQRARAVIDSTGATVWGKLDANRVMDYLAERRKDGLSIESSNHYLRRIKQFARWMVRSRRAPDSPLDCLTLQNANTDRKHSRRELSVEEMTGLLDAARRGAERFGMSGTDRAMLYTLALETGLRSNELRTLTWDCMDIESASPIVTVKAAYAKNRRADTLPLKPTTAQSLARWREARGEVESSDPVFPTMPLKWRIPEMLRDDLTAARESWIKAAVNTKDREQRERSGYCKYKDESDRVCDFHALRHSFISNLARGGVHPKVAQLLARHSSIVMTMDRYTHTVRGELSDALAVLPDLSDRKQPERMKAVGTYDDRAGIDPNKAGPARMTKSCQSAVQSGVNGTARPDGNGQRTHIEKDNISREKPRNSRRKQIEGAGGRTQDLRLKRPLLYH